MSLEHPIVIIQVQHLLAQVQTQNQLWVAHMYHRLDNDLLLDDIESVPAVKALGYGITM